MFNSKIERGITFSAECFVKVVKKTDQHLFIHIYDSENVYVSKIKILSPSIDDFEDLGFSNLFV